MSARETIQKQYDDASAKSAAASAKYRELLKSRPTNDAELRKACDEASDLVNESAALKSALDKLPAEPLKVVK